jgi:glucans biosynthesis protein C
MVMHRGLWIKPNPEVLHAEVDLARCALKQSFEPSRPAVLQGILKGSGTSFLNMHLSDFPQYILLFAAGIMAARKGWLLDFSFSTGMRWLMVVFPLGFVAWLILFLKGGALAGNSAAYSGGLHWQAASLNLWESFTCLAMSYGFLVFYAKKFNSQGRLAKFFSDNALSVYVFHPPVLILCARALHASQLPILVRFVLLTFMASGASFFLSAAIFRRIPFLRQIL